MRSARMGDAFRELMGTKLRRAGAPSRCSSADVWNCNPRSAFLFRPETQQEQAMPYLFWAVLPFALMDTWWGMCENRRDTE